MTFFLKDRTTQVANQPANPAPQYFPNYAQIISAGAKAEALETDYWGKTTKTKRALVASVQEQIAAMGGTAPDPDAPDFWEVAANTAAIEPGVWGDLPISKEALEKQTLKRLRDEYAEAQQILDIGGSSLAEFVGRSATAMTDPISLAMLPLGGPITSQPLKFIAREAVLGGIGEAVILPRMYEMAERLDISDPDPVTQVALGAILAGGLSGALVAGQRGLEYLGSRPAGAQAGGPAGAPAAGVSGMTPGQRGATYGQARQAATQASRPADVETTEHAARMDETQDAMAAGEPMPEFEPEPPAARVEDPEPEKPAGKPDPEQVGANIRKLIGGAEAPAGYDTVSNTSLVAPPKPITTMTIREVRAWQEQSVSAGSKSSAAGQYQIIRKTLDRLTAKMGLTGDEIFDEGMQDAMADVLLREAGLDQFLAGEISANQFANKLAKTWAGLPLVDGPNAGRSVYAGDGLNAATVTPDEVLAVLGGAEPKARTGRGYTTGRQITTPTGRAVDVEYEVVDAEVLVAAAGDLQPRDRSRAASDEQIAEIAARLDPERLMPSPEADRGTPIVGPDNVVESGNGRVAAIVQAAERFPDRYQAYTNRIAEQFEIPSHVRRPVLIARRTSDLDDASRRDFVREANTSSIARMSATEQAGLDAAGLDAAVLNLYQPGSRLEAPANRSFIKAVLSKIPQAERNGLVTAEGYLNADGLRRIRQAVFARAYDSPDLLANFAEAGAEDMRSLINALADMAPEWARFREEIAAGDIKPEMDITGQLEDAVRLIAKARADARKEGISVKEALSGALGQADLLQGSVDPVIAGLVNVFYKGGRARSADDVLEVLNNYVIEARIAGSSDAGLFGDTLSSGPREVIHAIQKDQAGLFSDSGRSFGPGDQRFERGAAGPGSPQDRRAARDTGAERPAGDTRQVEPDEDLRTDRIDDEDLSEGAQSQTARDAADQAMADIRADIEASGDFDIPMDDGTTVRASDLLDDLEDDAELVDVLDSCRIGGGGNA